jgi:hypothetical protein
VGGDNLGVDLILNYDRQFKLFSFEGEFSEVEINIKKIQILRLFMFNAILEYFSLTNKKIMECSVNKHHRKFQTDFFKFKPSLINII